MTTAAEDILATAWCRFTNDKRTSTPTAHAVHDWYQKETPTRAELAVMLGHTIDLLIEEANKS